MESRFCGKQNRPDNEYPKKRDNNREKPERRYHTNPLMLRANRARQTNMLQAQI